MVIPSRLTGRRRPDDLVGGFCPMVQTAEVRPSMRHAEQPYREEVTVPDRFWVIPMPTAGRGDGPLWLAVVGAVVIAALLLLKWWTNRPGR
jgi:hypothetical protein